MTSAQSENPAERFALSPVPIYHYATPYLHPYTGAEYPDVMVQMAMISPLQDYLARYDQ